MKKENRIIIFLFLILVFIGIVSYEVYSYYNASGDFSSEQSKGKNTIYFNDESFNPRITNNLDTPSVFISEEQSYNLSCSNSSLLCTGIIYIINEGSSDIEIEIINPDVELDDDSVDKELSFAWTNATVNNNNTKKAVISAGETATLTVGVSIISDNLVGGSDEAVEVFAPTGSANVNIVLHFDMNAIQAH